MFLFLKSHHFGQWSHLLWRTHTIPHPKILGVVNPNPRIDAYVCVYFNNQQLSPQSIDCQLPQLLKGPYIKYVTLEGVRDGVTVCDRGGREPVTSHL